MSNIKLVSELQWWLYMFIIHVAETSRQILSHTHSRTVQFKRVYYSSELIQLQSSAEATETVLNVNEQLTLSETRFIPGLIDAEHDHKCHASYEDHWAQNGRQLSACVSCDRELKIVKTKSNAKIPKSYKT